MAQQFPCFWCGIPVALTDDPWTPRCVDREGNVTAAFCGAPDCKKAMDLTNFYSTGNGKCELQRDQDDKGWNAQHMIRLKEHIRVNHPGLTKRPGASGLTARRVPNVTP